MFWTPGRRLVSTTFPTTASGALASSQAGSWSGASSWPPAAGGSRRTPAGGNRHTLAEGSHMSTAGSQGRLACCG